MSLDTTSRLRAPTKFGYVSAADMQQIAALLLTAADVFGTEQESSQIQAEYATFEKLTQLSRQAIGVRKTSEGQIVAWCTVFPTTAALMQGFLAGAITERSLFEQTSVGDSGALYLMSVYIFPEHRGSISPERLIKDTIAPLLAVPCPIFYHGLTDHGARLGTLLQKKFSRRGYQILCFKAPVLSDN